MEKWLQDYLRKISGVNSATPRPPICIPKDPDTANVSQEYLDSIRGIWK